MRLYDSLKKEVRSLDLGSGVFRVYACGPTVYHYIHIGNLRTFCVTDLLRRYLEYRGVKVKLVMNITDVGHMLNDAEDGEDKLEAAAKKEKKSPREIADFYTKAFFEDIDAIGIHRADAYPKATENIPGMVELVETLLAKELAYQTDKGDIYFDVSKFVDYGKLSGNTVSELKAGARVDVKDDKRHPADFALWINNPDHVLQWEGPRGIKGYPGWHLECSVMAMKYLESETIDLHIGGEDLKFPHHECEIAQAEGATGHTFSRSWLHVSYLMVEGEKMSKSKGNFYRLPDLVAKGYSPEAIRLLLLSAHYRSQLNFTLDGLKAAEKTIRQFRETVHELRAASGNDCMAAETMAAVAEARQGFEGSLDEDLNVSGALAALHEFMRAMNRLLAEGGVGAECGSQALAFLERVEEVLGFGLFIEETVEISAEVQSLLDERKTARAEKRWADSDRLRDAIAEKGFQVEDTADGQKVKKS